MNEKISVIIPVYNVEKYLSQCIESVTNQTYKNIEILLVDDKSTDNSGKICDEYAEKYTNIITIHKPVNEGLGQARNTGLMNSSGEYVCFIDSDDYIDKNMLSDLYRAIKETNSDYAFTGYCRIYNNEILNKYPMVHTQTIWFKDEVNNFICDLISLPANNIEDSAYGASVCKALFDISIIKNNNIQFYSEREYIAEDLLFDIMYLSKAKSIVSIPGIYYYYRFNPNSLTTNYKQDRFYQNKILYFKILETLKNCQIKFDEIVISRYFLTFTRVCMIQEISFLEMNGYMKVYNNIKGLLNDKNLSEILSKYPIHQMSFKNKLLFKSIKRKKTMLVLIILLVYKLKKG